jgi:hypothetical protein
MKLREHPLMSYKGLSSWPPMWVRADLRQQALEQEAGVLSEVRLHDLGSCKIFLGMQYDGSRYIGYLWFDDQPFCVETYNLLKSCIGCSIKDIGDTDVE